MAQKSLPILNKVNTSMIWYTTFYFKYYKWLSSQTLYFLYFLNKLFVYLDFFFSKLLWIKPYNTYLYDQPRRRDFTKRIRIRYFKPVTAYLATFDNVSIVFNLFYKTTLERFQAMDAKKDEETEEVLPAMKTPYSMQRIFFR